MFCEVPLCSGIARRYLCIAVFCSFPTSVVGGSHHGSHSDSSFGQAAGQRGPRPSVIVEQTVVYVSCSLLAVELTNPQPHFLRGHDGPLRDGTNMYVL